MNKEKVIIFGKGGYFNIYEEDLFERYDIVAIVDNDVSKHGQYNGIPVVGVDKINLLGRYRIIIVLDHIDYEIVKQLVVNSIELNRISPFFKPGYLGWDDYSAVFVEDNGNYAVRIVIDKYGLTFLLRTKTDYVIFDEIYLNCNYRINIPQKEDYIIVIDIGMNVGLATLYFAKDQRVYRVYGYEPFEDTFAMAEDNIRMNSNTIQRKIHRSNYALGGFDGERRASYEKDQPGNMSIVDDVNLNITEGERKRIKIKEAGRVLKAVFEENEKATIIVKCDCEGSEYEIFDSLKNYDLIDRVSYYIIETHLGRGDELLKILDDYGYRSFSQVSRDGRLGMIYSCK